jgi:hypothetical protein
MGQLTLATIRGRVRSHIDEPIAAYWTDAELNNYISDAELDLWTKIFALKKDYWLATATLNLTIGVSLYNGGDGSGMPVDIFRVESIRTLTSGYQNILWRETSPNSQAFLDGLNTDFPVYNPLQILYALRNITTLAISPVPQQGPLSALINYIQQPTPMVADSDTFLIPDTFMRFVQYTAAAIALSKGPVGDSVAWAQRAATAWKEIAEALDTPRTSQGPDLVEGFSEGAGGW